MEIALSRDKGLLKCDSASTLLQLLLYACYEHGPALVDKTRKRISESLCRR